MNKPLVLLPLLLPFFLYSTASASPAELGAPTRVAGFTAEPVQEGSEPFFFPVPQQGEVGRTAYFRANDGVHGVELWRTDGTAAGTGQEAACIPETLCVSGAVPGRSELFVRVVGPKGNGRLWPTLVRFTTSTVEVWVEQVASGDQRYYLLEGATPGSSDLSGLFDRAGFEP